ncbi:biotin transporter BioY [Natrinema hispanicum]|uniref:Biotin transport system substrate-specific component n=1 Tax=Natrinema hispanicum TaxID=392421 RepID=A0A1H9ZNF9_9EURY|nr:biotin transporter BioY [Natrinema hispanicum]SDC08203.1 biotin transport system substrate-specific component [Natrinema hispanicum]SES83098.1 biotin transport system substrate-specific component [Natrinema hispanicum]
MATDQHSVELVDDDVVKPFARAAVLAALMGAAVFVGSIPIPFSPIPISLGVIVVYLAGLYLGPYWGAFSLLLYLTAGAVGLPIFAERASGLGVLVGNSAGYLWSYPTAALLIGAVVHRLSEDGDPADLSRPVLVVTLLAALTVIYLLGAAWLGYVLELSTVKAIEIGVVPFIPGDLIKIAAVVAIVEAERIAT